MALRSFSKNTLQDNWYEERASSLRGVLPFDGQTSYATTNDKDFTNPSDLHKKNDTFKPQNHNGCRLIRRDNLDQATKSRPLRDRPDHGFGAPLPTPDVNANTRYLQTTNHVAFGTPDNTAKLINNQQGPAGGAGGARVERGKAASGASGEVIKVHADPQKDTHAQRSWMYTKDPIFDAKRDSSSSNNAQITVAKPAHFRRQATSITTIDQKKNGIFVDD
ncbi:hypothetical protein AC1031_007047 [Aphanomyces cochlioides]|nr:hypothetical protein AC1031_007047 [Aphanomyces cochlioides]